MDEGEFPRQFDGRRGRQVTVQLQREAEARQDLLTGALVRTGARGLGWDAAQDLPSRLPQLTAEEVHEFVATIVFVPQMREERSA